MIELTIKREDLEASIKEKPNDLDVYEMFNMWKRAMIAFGYQMEGYELDRD